MADPPPSNSQLAERVRRAMDRLAADGESEDATALVAGLFEECFGGIPERTGSASVYLPLIAEQTSYFGGFGLLLRTPATVTVALRRGLPPARTVISGLPEGLVQQMLPGVARAAGAEDGAFDAAIICSPAGADPEAQLAATAVATARALNTSPDTGALAGATADLLGELLGHPCGPSYVLASSDGGPVVLVDATVMEHVDIERPDGLGCAVLDLAHEERPPDDYFATRIATVESSVDRLRQRGFQDLTSLRQLEHQDLPRALEGVDPSDRPFLKHLITEDRRVGRLVGALRRDDLQVAGALLLMSHASRRDDALASTDRADFIVRQAEEADAIYGARLIGAGFGGLILIVGRPFLLPDIIDRIGEAYLEHYGSLPIASLV